MKKIRLVGLALLLTVVGVSCAEDDLMYDNSQKRSVYFDRKNAMDTVFFSFVSVEGDTYGYEIPVRVIGKPIHEVQKCLVLVVADSTTARENTHYTVGELSIPADSVRGTLIVTLSKTDDMKEHPYYLYMQFDENDYFKPIASDGYRLAITDGEYTRPAWWKDGDLGTYSSGLFKRILEKYWELEELRPVEYAYFEETYGRLLEFAPEWFWSSKYPAIWVKYVLKPVYEYYQEHPTDGVNMPNPDKFIS